MSVGSGGRSKSTVDLEAKTIQSSSRQDAGRWSFLQTDAGRFSRSDNELSSSGSLPHSFSTSCEKKNRRSLRSDGARSGSGEDLGDRMSSGRGWEQRTCWRPHQR